VFLFFESLQLFRPWSDFQIRLSRVLLPQDSIVHAANCTATEAKKEEGQEEEEGLEASKGCCTPMKASGTRMKRSIPMRTSTMTLMTTKSMTCICLGLCPARPEHC
jgi:hypothetical protein